MQQLLWFLHIVICVTLIILVLLQHGKGADMGVALGGGSGSVFGSQGSTAFLVKITTVMAVLFFISSLVVGYWAGHLAPRDAVLQNLASHAQTSHVLKQPASTEKVVQKTKPGVKH